MFGDVIDEPEPPKKGGKVSQLFEPTEKEKEAETRRKHDHRIGLLIGPKNLVKLRTFGYDVAMVNPEGLSSGVAHRGMNE